MAEDFSWTKNAWKGLKGALASAATVALIFGLDAFLQGVDTPSELGAIGIPIQYIPLLMAAVAMLRNYLKHTQRRVPIP